VPAGARLMADTVAALARGPVEERAQQPSAPARRRATWRQKRELRRVVAARRRDLGRLTDRPAGA
jgi:hypothetical protein